MKNNPHDQFRTDRVATREEIFEATEIQELAMIGEAPEKPTGTEILCDILSENGEWVQAALPELDVLDGILGIKQTGHGLN